MPNFINLNPMLISPDVLRVLLSQWGIEISGDDADQRLQDLVQELKKLEPEVFEALGVLGIVPALSKHELEQLIESIKARVQEEDESDDWDDFFENAAEIYQEERQELDQIRADFVQKMTEILESKDSDFVEDPEGHKKTIHLTHSVIHSIVHSMIHESLEHSAACSFEIGGVIHQIMVAISGSELALEMDHEAFNRLSDKHQEIYAGHVVDSISRALEKQHSHAAIEQKLAQPPRHRLRDNLEKHVKEHGKLHLPNHKVLVCLLQIAALDSGQDLRAVLHPDFFNVLKHPECSEAFVVKDLTKLGINPHLIPLPGSHSAR